MPISAIVEITTVTNPSRQHERKNPPPPERIVDLSTTSFIS